MGNTIEINGRPVGLFGLEFSLDRVKKKMRSEGLTPRQAANELLSMVSKKNYIPSGREKDYLRAFETLLDGAQKNRHLTKIIRILGPGCVGCNRLEAMVLEVLSENGIAADIFHVTDRDEIFRFGVTQTPALVIDDKVVSAGKIPTKAQIQKWLKG